jgi:hypothetical protein
MRLDDIGIQLYSETGPIVYFDKAIFDLAETNARLRPRRKMS